MDGRQNARLAQWYWSPKWWTRSKGRHVYRRSLSNNATLKFLADTDKSYLEEPPETPAPVFAVRAFKTALFGTPLPKLNEEAVNTDQLTAERHTKLPAKSQVLTPKNGSKICSPRISKAMPAISPAKGILLTPGTAATRRKTVSFGSPSVAERTLQEKKTLEPKAGSCQIQDTDEPQLGMVQELVQSDHPRPAAPAKTLFNAQIGNLNQQQTDDSNCHEKTTKASHNEYTVPKITEVHVEQKSIETAADTTVDLSKPRSQSGQHWKSEYERYQLNSDREMKLVIQHGQVAKSYAEKKDHEATYLQEKLKRELSKCAATELKVSELAAELASRGESKLKRSTDQSKLVHDLARKTALAVKHKQKADGVRLEIMEHEKAVSARDDSQEVVHPAGLGTDANQSGADASMPEFANPVSELSALRVELDTIRTELRAAEEKTTKLEAENAKLRKFLRVKDEMQNYDGRRLPRDARFKQREEKLEAEKKACEEKLERLTIEHSNLLRKFSRQSTNREMQQQPNPSSANNGGLDRITSHGNLSARARSGPMEAIRRRAPKESQIQLAPSSRQALTAPQIDIWAADQDTDTGESASLPPPAEPAINLPSINLSKATHDALQEIDANSASDYQPETDLPPDTLRPTLEHLAAMDSSLQSDFPSSEPSLCSAVKRMNERKRNIASPRPSILNMASSPVKDDATPRAAGWSKNTSVMSGIGTRTSTLNGGRSRLEHLPPDRAAAAKARLAQRKKTREARRT